MRKIMRNPFPQQTLVRFRRCGDPGCLCRYVEAGIGVVRELSGKTIIVDFGNRHEGLMEVQIGFRLSTAEAHLEKVEFQRVETEAT